MSAYATTQPPTATEAPPVASHKPTCAVPWPTTLLEGGEKAGKSTEAAKFTGCGKFSKAFWFELGTEGTAEWYGLVPGAEYEVLEHDGKFATLKQRIAEVHAYAEWAIANGLPPVCFVLDTVGALWKQIQTWVDWKATQSVSAKRKLQADPAAEISAPIAVRNQGKALWDEILMSIHRIPGVKILLSRGQEVTVFKDGQPTNDKGWSVVGHKELGFEVDVWARLVRGRPVELHAVRHPVQGIQPDGDGTETETVRRRDFSLEWLIFERYGLDPANASVRNLHNVNDPSSIEETAAARAAAAAAADPTGMDEDLALVAAQLLDAAEQTTTKAAFMPLWQEMKTKGLHVVRLAGGELQTLMEAQARRIGQLEAQNQAGEPAPGPAPAPAPVPTPVREPEAAAEPPAPEGARPGGITVEQRRELGRLMLSLGVNSDKRATWSNGRSGRLAG
jgi:hypothetical protein